MGVDASTPGHGPSNATTLQIGGGGRRETIALEWYLGASVPWMLLHREREIPKSYFGSAPKNTWKKLD